MPEPTATRSNTMIRLAMLAMLALIPASGVAPPPPAVVPAIIQPRPGASHHGTETTGAARLFYRAGGRCSAARLSGVLARVRDVIPIPQDKLDAMAVTPHDSVPRS